jgi:cysteine desulfurase / selenocysteine lyase
MTPPTAPVPDLREVRAREFPDLGCEIYLNAASVTPLPQRSAREVARFNELRTRVGALRDEEFGPPLQRSRRAAAALIGAHPDEIALGWNTSFGINLAALGLSVEPGAAIVVSEREFPANVYPWMGVAGARLEIVPTDAYGWPDEARLLERLDRGDVAVFALSSVQFASGYLADVAGFGRFCRERGIVFVVDAIQSLGQVPMDVNEACVDVLACGGHKWLLSPFGTGFAFVRRELQPRLEPRIVGWTAMTAAEDFNRLVDYRWEWKEGARRYEVATPPFQDLAGLAASLELLLEVRPARIRAHLLEILAPLREWLAAVPGMEMASCERPETRTGIVAFRPPRPEATFRALSDAGVVCVLREGAIRLSAHLYNTREEIEQVVELLAEHGGAG